MKKNMCKNYLYGEVECGYIRTKYCPANTNSKCEIIPSKKERVVKAWISDEQLNHLLKRDRHQVVICTWAYKPSIEICVTYTLPKEGK